jgi:hypothetical protein
MLSIMGITKWKNIMSEDRFHELLVILLPQSYPEQVLLEIIPNYSFSSLPTEGKSGLWYIMFSGVQKFIDYSLSIVLPTLSISHITLLAEIIVILIRKKNKLHHILILKNLQTLITKFLVLIKEAMLLDQNEILISNNISISLIDYLYICFDSFFIAAFATHHVAVFEILLLAWNSQVEEEGERENIISIKHNRWIFPSCLISVKMPIEDWKSIVELFTSEQLVDFYFKSQIIEVLENSHNFHLLYRQLLQDSNLMNNISIWLTSSSSPSIIPSLLVVLCSSKEYIELLTILLKKIQKIKRNQYQLFHWPKLEVQLVLACFQSKLNWEALDSIEIISQHVQDLISYDILDEEFHQSVTSLYYNFYAYLQNLWRGKKFANFQSDQFQLFSRLLKWLLKYHGTVYGMTFVNQENQQTNTMIFQTSSHMKQHILNKLTKYESYFNQECGSNWKKDFDKIDRFIVAKDQISSIEQQLSQLRKKGQDLQMRIGIRYKI